MELPTPGVDEAPKNAIWHGACQQWWTGAERAHCGGCHITLSSLTAFERHRRGMRCNPPTSVGLVARPKPYGTLWGLPAPIGGYGALRGASEAEAA
ncbi:FDXHR family putative zinc-binding protein [Streptomyces lasiicapitis]|uniref:FDXHR family putative zinc-binding protein n=1 Tax=Streptomyces lasiicapitis TaxID=1923961 RepID=UPI0036CC9673